jgi:hypothetical protein
VVSKVEPLRVVHHKEEPLRVVPLLEVEGTHQNFYKLLSRWVFLLDLMVFQ